ncbi:TadE/TadG family type IV pilus assembly protein [uncultured Novosphingobium sp.]|uniref:pilus assembly protein n=1 Tax=uncultured Novosphingobium sp. TaxID=292277 RepID=UPI00258D5E7B|nr:TadE/TadG family type IV pilus assembly protein [uncultured Novosphingobium sp.]
MPNVATLIAAANRWIADWRRLWNDTRGNTFMIAAAAMVPMLAMVGSGIDMSRGYLARTRLQEACDAGVLATRKKIGSTVITNNVIPTDAAAAGNRFFNLNFQDGAYGTTNRTFTMTLLSNYTINGTATATVPTSVMKLFMIDNLPITVNCSAQFNYSNSDIMMVLDTTGSMNDTNPGDTSSKISVLRQVVKDFYTSVEATKGQDTRIRYGFVPYSTNVNVGFLLKSGWMVNQNNYETRSVPPGGNNGKWRYASRSINLNTLKNGNSDALYSGGTITEKIAGTPSSPLNTTLTYGGCIEERATYVIDDYNNVDLTRARDLDIDAVPVSNNPDTQWRPLLPELAYLRGITNWGNYLYGSWSPGSVDYSDDYTNASALGFAACPAKARKLAEMTATDVNTYVNSLVAAGSTYHDIGMIWGGRLISPTGLFAAENAEINGRPTTRHLIFLTDGETSPLEYSYDSYGVEPLSQKRWNSGSKYTLTQTVENRFTVACNQVKNKNVTVWTIGFGTAVTDLMKNCAGPGHWFQASNSKQLADAFAAIAASIGDLRIIK